MAKPCKVAGCDREGNVSGSALGYCRAHYKKHIRYGDAERPTPPRASRLLAERFWEKVAQGGADDCWEWQASRDELGYGFFRVDSAASMVKAHRVAWVLTHGAIPAGASVCHHCDNPPCCNPAHLFVGTHQANMRDRNAKGRTTKGRTLHHGEGSGRSAKLTLEQVRAIRTRYATGGISQHALGVEFGVGQVQVGRIIRGDRWAHDT